MDRRDRDTTRRKNIAVYCQNSNGNPQNQRLTREALVNLGQDHEVIAVFNDVRCQEAANLNFPNFSTLLANDPKKRHYAGGTGILFPNTWTATTIDQDCKEGLREHSDD